MLADAEPRTGRARGGPVRPALVLSDLDDTFLAHDKSLPETNRAALDALAVAGVAFVPCTGRSTAAVPEALLTHPATSHVIACNGGKVVDVASGEVLRSTALSVGTVLAAYEALSALDVTFDVFVGDHVYAEAARLDRALVAYGLDDGTVSLLRAVREPVDVTVPETLARLGVEAVDKVTVYWGDEAARDEAARALAGMADVDVTSSHARNFEFMAAGVSKGAALLWLASHLGVAHEATVAFGDARNDVDMLVRAGTGVAVGNACPEALAAADEVCGGCDEGGPGRWLLELLG